VIDIMKRPLITLIVLLAYNYSFAEEVTLQCKPSGYNHYAVSVVINIHANTLKFGDIPYTINHVSEDYYHAYEIDKYGGEILLISRLNGQYWRGGVSTNKCTDSKCTDTYTSIDSHTGDCRLAF
jgi:hypothetical protein